MIRKENRLDAAARRRHQRGGFTILEVMVVLVILVMIAGLVYQSVFPQVEKAKVKTARAQIEILGVSLDSYRLDVGTYPNSLEDLITSSAPGWKGPYLRKNTIPPDPWNNAYAYESLDEGRDYHLSSTGGGKEPIKSWE